METPDEATMLVEGVVANLKGMGIDASGDLHEARTGHTAGALVDAAAAHNSDLIVLRSRVLGNLQGILTVYLP